MALIKCPECGHEISSYADKCIYCGCPMDQIKKLINNKIDPIVQKPTAPLIVQNDGKFLSLLDDDARNFINGFNEKLEQKYPRQYGIKENNKSFAFKFAKYPKLLLHFKLVKNSGALKLEYKTTGKKRRLMPASKGKYNLDRLLSKLFPELDKYFDSKEQSTFTNTLEKNAEQANTAHKSFWDELSENEQNSIDGVINLIHQLSGLVTKTIYKNNYIHITFANNPSELVVSKVDNALFLKLKMANGEIKTYPFNGVRSKLGEIVVFIKQKKDSQSNNEQKKDEDSSNIGGLWLDINNEQKRTIIFAVKMLERRFQTKSIINCDDDSISVKFQNQTFELLFTKSGNNVLCKLKLSTGEARVYSIEKVSKKLGEMVVFIMSQNDNKPSTETKVDDSYKYSSYESEVMGDTKKKRKKSDDSNQPKLYVYLLKELKGKTYSATTKIKELCKDVAEFVKSSIGYNPNINKKYYTFFEHTFSYGYISYKEVELFYKFYKASVIVSLIESYERIYNNQIIYSKEELLHSLYQKFNSDDEIDFNTLKGITSFISYVPLSVLEEKLQYFASFEGSTVYREGDTIVLKITSTKFHY